MPKYGPKAKESVREAMHEFKRGKLKSSSGDKVKNPRQALAIGLSEARAKGAKMPPQAAKKGRKTKGKPHTRQKLKKAV